jgi:hypothetical protein
MKTEEMAWHPRRGADNPRGKGTRAKGRGPMYHARARDESTMSRRRGGRRHWTQGKKLLERCLGLLMKEEQTNPQGVSCDARAKCHKSATVQRKGGTNSHGMLNSLWSAGKEASREGEGSCGGRNQKKALDREFPHGQTA